MKSSMESSIQGGPNALMTAEEDAQTDLQEIQICTMHSSKPELSTFSITSNESKSAQLII